MRVRSNNMNKCARLCTAFVACTGNNSSVDGVVRNYDLRAGLIHADTLGRMSDSGVAQWHLFVQHQPRTSQSHSHRLSSTNI